MTVQLRPYQVEFDDKITAAYLAGAKVVAGVMPTGGGKTRVVAARHERHPGASCIIAHRSEIVSQLSMALAECGVRHNLIASKKDQRAIADAQVKEFGRNFFDPSARCAVASVDTLIKKTGLEAWAAQVTFWTVDEGHHLVNENKWHRAVQLFSNPACIGLLPTASPRRADGKGLGRPELGGDGIADVMVEGPSPRWLIDEGYLVDYRMIIADSHLQELLGEVSNSGDWSTAQLKAASEQSPIVGDAAATYAHMNAGRIDGIPASPNGRTGLLFSSDVDTASKFLVEMRRYGVRCELITGETDFNVRRRAFDKLKSGELELAVVVDIVSEGTDIPAVLLGIFGRATASLQVYLQQFGRMLRPLMTPLYRAARTREERLYAISVSGKAIAYIADHVGNFMRHGPPDRPRIWSLQSTSRKRGPSDGIAYRPCLNVPACGQPFERFRDCCPYCGWEPDPPAGRSSPMMVAGDMVLLDPEVLAALRGDAEAAVMSVADYRAKLAATGLPQYFIMANAKTQHAKIEGQTILRDVMATWGGYRKAEGLSDREMQKLFHEKFGVDVLTCLAYGPKEALPLMERVIMDGGINR